MDKKIVLTKLELNALVWWAYSGVTRSCGGSYGSKIIPLLKKLKKKYHIREPRLNDIEFKPSQ